MQAPTTNHRRTIHQPKYLHSMCLLMIPMKIAEAAEVYTDEDLTLTEQHGMYC